ncbi:MAG: TonB-dependent receptor plug domain-containing protein [Bryobacteraceae bacterium]
MSIESPLRLPPGSLRALALLAGLVRIVHGQAAGEDLSIEEILRTQITSVGRKAQQVAKAPAAVYVITQEDIRRSGATNIADLLRMAPGLVVGRINGSSWVISARGDARQFSNKMLVMIDGRSVYGRLFSGVFWNVQDVLLEDIDRIEVIRGPGAVMWGSNAVNGVISIITKKSQATQGGLVTLGGGTEDRAFAGFRYGGRRGDRLTYRAWGKFNAREYMRAGSAIYRPDPDYSQATRYLQREMGGEADHARLWRTGFRIDWEKSARDTVTMLGELYEQSYMQNQWELSPQGQVLRYPSGEKPWGGNILARWTRATSGDQDTTVQMWADHAAQSGVLYRLAASTVDADVQHRRLFSENNEVHIGGGYRLTADMIKSDAFRFRQTSRSDGLWNGVIRDEHHLLGRKLMVSAGIRGEHNGYTGFEYQPSARLMFTPVKEQAWWLAWSRAVRTPSRSEHDLDNLPLGITYFQQAPLILQLRGNSAYQSERLKATEAGFRFQHRHHWSVDVALFDNRYTRLSTLELGELHLQFQPVLDLRQDLFFANGRSGISRGGEIAFSVSPRPWWRLHGSYSYLRGTSDPDPERQSLDGRHYGLDPAHQAKLRSFWNLGRRWQADVSLFGVGRVPERRVAGYLRADTRLSWRPTRMQEWSFVTQDLFNNGRLEWEPDLYVYAIPTRRAVILRWTAQF